MTRFITKENYQNHIADLMNNIIPSSREINIQVGYFFFFQVLNY